MLHYVFGINYASRMVNRSITVVAKLCLFLTAVLFGLAVVNRARLFREWVMACLILYLLWMIGYFNPHVLLPE
jgi:hypothetical protein